MKNGKIMEGNLEVRSLDVGRPGVGLVGFILLILMALSFQSFGQSLEKYQELAAENNPGLKAKYKNFEAAMERVAKVSGLPDPTLSIGYFISPVETRVGPQRARFSLTQMFPWFGSLKAQEDASALMAEAKYQEFLDAQNKLYYQVSAAYYPLFELERFTAIEEDNRRILTTYKDIATVMFENDKGSMVDVLRVDLMLNDATTNLSILEKRKKPLVTRFNKLLDRDEQELISIGDSLQLTHLPIAYRRDSLLNSNPLLDELELKLNSSKLNEKAAVKQGLPKLGVGLDYVVVDDRADMSVPDNGKDVLMPMVSLSLPIFRKKHKAAQREARLLQESFSLQRENLSNRLVSEYERVWFETQKQAELIALYNSQIEESEQSLRLLYAAYSNSGKEFEEVLRMQQQILKYQKMKATALSEYHIAVAELDYITAKHYKYGRYELYKTMGRRGLHQCGLLLDGAMGIYSGLRYQLNDSNIRHRETDAENNGWSRWQERSSGNLLWLYKQLLQFFSPGYFEVPVSKRSEFYIVYGLFAGIY